VAVLSDQGLGDRKKVEEMKRSAVLGAGHFYTMADFLNRTEADIEDMLEPEVFASILNDCYGLSDAKKLTAEKLKAADPSTERLVKQADAALRVMPEPIPVFDHFAPAAWLIRNPRVLDGKSAAIGTTLDRAEKIFQAYNNLL